MQNRPSPDLKSVVEQARELLAAGLEEFGYSKSVANAAVNPITSPAIPTGAALRAIEKALLTQKDRLDKLEEALRPFAEVADWYDASEDDSFEVWQDYPHGLDRSRWSKLANFRKARAALTGSHT